MGEVMASLTRLTLVAMGVAMLLPCVTSSPRTGCPIPVPSSWRSESCAKEPCEINVFGGPCMGCACFNNGEHNPQPYGGMLCSSKDRPGAIPAGYDACLSDCADVGKLSEDCKAMHWKSYKKDPGLPGGDPLAYLGANWTRVK